ncbi:Lin1244/Lin1753 domain-containing protein [Capnocytophaga cynodegmi]|uniref:Lin1244/Lin1753 domain-containing protein n=1 Tax=Capnocytophaga cynodegmi TaxID=28189 RepID=UPI0038581DF1
MSKNNFYFSHDGNARNDEKLLSVRVNMGAEGYGIYFMIIEKLLESGEYTLIKDYNVIAFDLRVGSDKIKAVVENFGLFQFTEDGKRFYSESLLRRMKPLDNLRKQRSEAGKKSAENRKANDRSTTTSTTVEKENNKTPFLLGENSTKESKVNNISFLEKKKQKTYTSDEGEILENSENESLETDLKTEKELSKKVAAKKVFNFSQAMIDAGFDPELSAEWLKIRKAKKAVNSELAFKNFLREVEKSGRGPNEVLTLIVQKQWKGFEASWLHNEQFTIKNGQKSNTTGNYTRANAGGGYPTGQKISARAFLAKQYSEQLARNSEAGNITIEVETSSSE